jgi:hypothetical protein
MSVFDSILGGTVVNNWTGGVFGPTTSDVNRIGQEIARLPAMERQVNQLMQILRTAGEDEARRGVTVANTNPQLVEGFNQLLEARELLDELSNMAREGLALAIEAGEISAADIPGVQLEGLPILAVVARVGVIIARFFTSAKVVAWAAKFLRLATIIAAVQAIAHAIATAGSGVQRAGLGLQSATLPIILLLGLWLFSKWKRGKR